MIILSPTMDLPCTNDTLNPGNLTNFDPYSEYFYLTTTEFYIGHVACGTVPLITSLVPGIYILITISQLSIKKGFHQLPLVQRISAYLCASDVSFGIIKLVHHLWITAVIKPLPGLYCYITGEYSL